MARKKASLMSAAQRSTATARYVAAITEFRKAYRPARSFSEERLKGAFIKRRKPVDATKALANT